MNIKTLFEENEPFTLDKYLFKKGVINTELWKNPNAQCLDSPDSYENMNEGFKLLMSAIGGDA